MERTLRLADGSGRKMATATSSSSERSPTGGVGPAARSYKLAPYREKSLHQLVGQGQAGGAQG
eukprot:1662524-Pyramimonas_sp.AAC.1